MRRLLALYFLTITVSAQESVVFQEDFSNDPMARGWSWFGDGELFAWDTANQALQVTWDSSRPNSYFHRPLGTIVTSSDDFSFAFDLRLDDIVGGVNTNKSFTFQLAVGLLNFADATRTNYFRGSGVNPNTGPRNVVEFNYFPAAGFTEATISPTIVSSNNQFASRFSYPGELTPDDWFHVDMTYTADTRTMVTTLTRNGAPFGPVDAVTLSATFTDFRVDTLAICSFNDSGQHPVHGGSLLAHGLVDNIATTTPPPPVGELRIRLEDGGRHIEFSSRPGWFYILEQSDDLDTWTSIGNPVPGMGTILTLTDQGTLANPAFYRVRAERP